MRSRSTHTSGLLLFILVGAESAGLLVPGDTALIV
jgi:hypothetical protein